MVDAWRIEPPVVKLTKEQVKVECREFIDKVDKFKKPATGGEMWNQTNWAKVAADSIVFATGLHWLNKVPHPEYFGLFQYSYFAYKPSGRVVGLMQTAWSRPGNTPGLVVWSLAMLPEHESEGAILIEYAVNLSDLAGHEGRVRFAPFENKVHPHKPAWFKYLKSEYVVPRNEEEKWEEVGDMWRLKEYLLPPEYC